MFNLNGKVALVTGATGALGYAIAKKLHQQGAVLALSGTRVEKLESLAQELGPRAAVFPCDLTHSESVEQLVPRVEQRLGSLDILINNAGLTRDGLALRMKEEEWDLVLKVNLKSAFQLSQAALKGMLKRRHGRIINITSVVGVTGNPGQANYCAAKAGMIGMSKALALEVASRHVTINCVAPGFIASDMTQALTEKQKEHILSRIPQNRIGLPEDVAHAVVFLSSAEASYITGQTLHVNGGLAMI